MKGWLCTGCNFKNFLDDKECPNCGEPRGEVKLNKGIAKRSVKETHRMKEYNKLVKEFLKGKRCVVYPHKRANQVHHAAGRGRLLLDTGYFIPVSADGHAWIHQHPAEARRKGWMILRTTV